MLVRDAMSTVVLTIGPTHTLRQAARLMAARRVGAAVVLDPDTSGLGILTERDILNSLGQGQDPDRETASTHTTTDVVFAAPGWTLEEAADAMSHGGFRHLIVLDGAGPVGVVSVRDIIRCWAPSRRHPAELVG
ncbi:MULTISPECIES: CBS domain-containing protein [unclassified Streptomyces]|uniref:CBS domain-containing protein n=1 Tax=unclassified Streptomyces TaxID=2593676 RepID=UPI0033DC8BEB